MNTISRICHKCQLPFKIPTKEYNRQLKKGREYFFCTLSCSQSVNHTIHSKITSQCLWCKQDFETTTHKRGRKCCSHDCAHKYSQSKTNPKVHREAMIKCGNKIRIFPIQKMFKCVVCKNNFQKMVKNNTETKQTCSKKCFGKMVSEWTRNNPNCGGKLGYRRFKYNGFTMDSRWEVEIAKWLDEKKIRWERSRKKHMFWWNDESGNKRKYFPDFYLPELGVYLDPKNDYYLVRDMPKLTQVINTYKITLFYGQVDGIKQQVSKISI